VSTIVSISGGSNVDVTVFGRGTVYAGNGNDSIDITGGGLIVVGSGNDTLTLNEGGVIREHGASGHDTINIGTGNATIYEQGDATITGAFGSATITGGGILEINQTGDSSSGSHSSGGNGSHSSGSNHSSATAGAMTQVGSQVHSELVGGAGAYMSGAQGTYTFVSGQGKETMTGGSGHNLFEILAHQNGGFHLIQNFVSGKDLLYVEGHSLSYLQSHHDITSHGGSTYISVDGGMTTIELQGVTTLKASDITDKY